MQKNVLAITYSIVFPTLWLVAAVLMGALIGTLIGGVFVDGAADAPVTSPYAIAYTMSDPYHPTMNVGSTAITLITDEKLVASKLAEYNEGRDTVAYALAVYTEKECTIYVSEPEGRNDIEGLSTLGHEVLHCFKGCYHEGGCTERILAKE